MIPRRVMLFACVFLVLIVLSSATAWAQFTSGIEGTVSDPTGAVVPGATVTIKNEETGASQTVQTAGFRIFPLYHAALVCLHRQRCRPGIQDHGAGTCSAAGSRNQDRQHPHGGRRDRLHGDGNRRSPGGRNRASARVRPGFGEGSPRSSTLGPEFLHPGGADAGRERPRQRRRTGLRASQRRHFQSGVRRQSQRQWFPRRVQQLSHRLRLHRFQPAQRRHQRQPQC